jgi:hypothetical protein
LTTRKLYRRKIIIPPPTMGSFHICWQRNITKILRRINLKVAYKARNAIGHLVNLKPMVPVIKKWNKATSGHGL